MPITTLDGKEFQIPEEWIEKWLEQRFKEFTADFLGRYAAHVPVVNPAGPGQGGHQMMWLDQNNDIVADRLSLSSHDLTAQPAFVRFSGTLAPGDLIGVSLNFGSESVEIVHGVSASDTWTSVLESIEGKIKDNAVCRKYQCHGERQVGADTFLVNPWALFIPTVSAVVSGNVSAAVEQSNGRLDINPILNLTRKIPEGFPIPPGSLIGGIPVVAPDANGEERQYLVISISVVNPDPGSLESEVAFGTPKDVCYWGNGMYLTSIAQAPTGKGKGPGTLNALDLFINGESVKTVLEDFEARLSALE